MKLCVFDKSGKVVFIEWKNVTEMHKVNRRMNYVTKEATYYGAITLKEEGRLHESKGFIQIDKNYVINMNHVDAIGKNNITIHGKIYPISRRKRAMVKRFFKNRKKDTNFET